MATISNDYNSIYENIGARIQDSLIHISKFMAKNYDLYECEDGEEKLTSEKIFNILLKYDHIVKNAPKKSSRTIKVTKSKVEDIEEEPVAPKKKAATKKSKVEEKVEDIEEEEEKSVKSVSKKKIEEINIEDLGD